MFCFLNWLLKSLCFCLMLTFIDCIHGFKSRILTEGLTDWMKDAWKGVGTKHWIFGQKLSFINSNIHKYMKEYSKHLPFLWFLFFFNQHTKKNNVNTVSVVKVCFDVRCLKTNRKSNELQKILLAPCIKNQSFIRGKKWIPHFKRHKKKIDKMSLLEENVYGHIISSQVHGLIHKTHSWKHKRGYCTIVFEI